MYEALDSCGRIIETPYQKWGPEAPCTTGGSDMVIVRYVQSFLFILTFFVFSAIWALVIRGGILFQCSPEWALRRLRNWAQVTVWLLKYVASIKVNIEGEENVPEGPCIFLSRHESFFDTLIYFLISLKTCYVMKIELRGWALYGFISEFVGLLFVDRADRGMGSLRKLIEEIKERLRKGRHIVYFPQGTRVRPRETGRYAIITYAVYGGMPDVQFVPVALSTGTSWPARSWMVNPGTEIGIRICPALPPGLTKKEFERRMVESIEEGSRELRDKA